MMPTPTPSSSIATISSSRSPGRFVICALGACLLACDRFPRNNPLYYDAGTVDNRTPPFEPVVAERSPLIDDQVGLSLRNNGNRRAEPGETVRVQVFVSCNDDANHTLVYSSAQPSPQDSCIFSVGVPSTTSTLLGQESAATSVGTLAAFDVQLRAEPCSTGRAEFSVILEDLGRGRTLELSPSFAVSAPDGQLALTSMSVIGGLIPGRMVVLQPEITNIGASRLRAVVLTVPPPGGCLLPMFTGQRVTLGDLQPSESQTLSTTELAAVVDANCADGDPIEFNLQLEDASGQAFPLVWSYTVGP